MSAQEFVLSGNGAFATGIAASLRQCGLSVRAEAPGNAAAMARPATGPAVEMLSMATGDSSVLCHLAASDDGVAWSLADARCPAPIPPPLAAFRRAASYGTAAHSDGPGPQSPQDTIATIAAKQIAYTMLRCQGQAPPPSAVTFLDRRTLRTSTHNVTVHPYDRPAKQRTQGEFQRDQIELRNGPPLGRPELTERWQRLSDDRFGAFAELDDKRFRQLPLRIALARLSDPCGLLSAPPAVVGAGLDRESARERAMLQALAAYGSVVVDPRLLVDRNGTFLGRRDGDATRLLGPVRSGSAEAFVRVIDLGDGQERLLPARQAFPVLRAPGPAQAPCGTSAALGWRQALAHGLLQHCARLTVTGSPGQARRPSALAAADFDQDCGVRFLAAMVAAAGIDVSLHDITGPAAVPVVAGTTACGETVYGAAAHLAEAVREALTAALFQYQCRRDPVLKASTPTPASAIWTSPASSASLSPGPLIEALLGLGYTPSVFALDHDRAVHGAFPYILRVALDPTVSAARP